MIRLDSIAMAACLLIGTSAVATASPIPVAWWRMNEASSGLVTAGQIQDFGSGGNSTNTVLGNPTWFTSGVPTTSINADGRAVFTDGFTDEINFGQGAGDELRITGALTLWGRIRPSFLGGAGIASKYQSGSGSFILWYFEGLSADFARWQVFGPSGSASLDSPIRSFPENIWADIGAVFSPSSGGGANNGTMKIYRDGAVIASRTHDLTGIINTSRPFRLGASLPLGIEQFRVYNVALSNEEVSGLTTPTPEPSTVILAALGILALGVVVVVRKKYRRA